MTASPAGTLHADPRHSRQDGRDITEPDSIKDTTGTLDGKRALVTGGTRGMGAAIAELLAARNARVLATARHPAANCAARLIQADLAAPGGADLVAGGAIRVLGGLDIVVHCVGAPFAKPGGALALTDEDWMEALMNATVAAGKALQCHPERRVGVRSL